MQIFPLWLLMVLLLSGCAGGMPKFPDMLGVFGSKQQEEPPPKVEKPVVTQPALPEPVKPANDTPKPARAPTAKQTTSHIALLLPLKSDSFQSAAEAVRQGFQTAATVGNKKGKLPIKIYSSSDEASDVAALYQRALSEGAQAVVGPLTRDGVTALAGAVEMSVPTLALNTAEVSAPGNLYFFGMAVEAEARQIAQQMSLNNVQRAIVVTSKTALAKRLQTAFTDEWRALGGGVVREIEFNQDTAVFANLIDAPDSAVFLAVDFDKARTVRPWLPKNMVVYATSLVFQGNQNSKLNQSLEQVHFVDMPWVLQPGSPVARRYPRATTPLSIDKERWYALGIDAYRLVNLLINNKTQEGLPLNGVSGQVLLSGKAFQRLGSPALFEQGRALLLEE